MDSDDNAAADVFLGDWESETGVVPLYALLWVLDWGAWSLFCWLNWEIQGDSFGTRPKKMRISQRLFIRF